MPYLEQWWITGFVPDIYDYGVNENELFPIASVDFSNYPDMYKVIKEEVNSENRRKKLKDKIIFDDQYCIIWINW